MTPKMVTWVLSGIVEVGAFGGSQEGIIWDWKLYRIDIFVLRKSDSYHSVLYFRPS